MQVLKTWALMLVMYLVFCASLGPAFANRFVTFTTKSSAFV